MRNRKINKATENIMNNNFMQLWQMFLFQSQFVTYSYRYRNCNIVYLLEIISFQPLVLSLLLDKQQYHGQSPNIEAFQQS